MCYICSSGQKNDPIRTILKPFFCVHSLAQHLKNCVLYGEHQKTRQTDGQKSFDQKGNLNRQTGGQKGFPQNVILNR